MAKDAGANGDKAPAAKERDDDAAGAKSSKSPRKRRKVNHACVYCRRSHMTCDLERPCTRCIKRNIGHLCHDEPRDADTKKLKNGKAAATAAAEESDAPPPPQALPDVGRNPIASTIMGPPPALDGSRRHSSRGFGAAAVLGQGAPLPLVQPAAATGLQAHGLANSASANANQLTGFSDAWLTAQNFNDMSSYNPNYMVAPHVSHEFNLLDDFLHSGFLDTNGLAPDESPHNAALSRTGLADPAPGVDGKEQPKKARSPSDKTREYYLQAADPSGNDNAEERMARVLRAKSEAGLLKPFNYINGYARLGKYLDGHIAPSSKQKILRTINHFRPKFREKAQGLTDMQLLYVEMWFEKKLMDYDRVFASMAVPACCWRRTGEIFRGNKEMAELIKVPVDQLRDGKIALHQILTEESMVRYWEEFGTIAFDPAHETLLTACSLKNPSDASEHPIVKCCFSFSIRRDEHKLPALIVGNFLPHDTPQD
ncbi:fungal zn(2)-Cys(6) binuclear cluster domain-containing protein [Hirsutella rhossiliensis]|uniref:Fungal zn(2)-Cys(6) binuclear cluster domain-containing protein n=1 Tax=Hirsutella rhossiliensis TaxID=111463 RepID=A0A9P8SKH7_9HYPO|nr:fungal zn(2)-Cys(6) binuclear cluster domain-containing protein [Hirsutella rhossiliensis]KAH0966393.1 fungal zn(2)-Cys(6) binuclear cluster domain-containing protein [Hirsutella rhossiliensis]